MYILSKLPIVYVTKHEKNFTYAVSYHSFQKFLSTNEHFLPLKDVSLLSSYRSTNFFIWQFHIVINEDKLISLYTIFPIPDNLSIFFSKYLEFPIHRHTFKRLFCTENGLNCGHLCFLKYKFK